MDYEELSYEECFNKIFNEININKKSINKLNNIVINQKKEIEELKKEIEDLKKSNEKENLKINNKLNDIVINQENEIEYIYDNIANLNIEVKENIEKYNKLKNIIEIDIKKEIEKIEIEINEKNKFVEEENNEINNEIILLKETIQNIQENEIEYIYENIANLNIEVKENIKINSKTNNEIIELKEIKNNLHFSNLICSYNYHISYLKDIVKLEIDLFTKLINNNILPINFITPQGNNNDVGQYIHITSHFKYKDDNKYKLNKYLNDNDITNNKYNFNIASYVCFNKIKFTDVLSGYGNNYFYEKNINNKYAVPYFYSRSHLKGEINIQHKIISKNNFYKTLYNEKNELIIENNDFIKMIEMKEDIEEMEEMILDCLERYKFMKTLKTNIIYLNDK